MKSTAESLLLGGAAPRSAADLRETTLLPRLADGQQGKSVG
jgi:hypothetical protein